MHMACGKECEENVCVETELHGLRLSWAESVRCGHSCKIYIYMRARVRSETELGRESQEWPRVYEKYAKEKKIKLLCETCVTCVENSDRILTCINMHFCTISYHILIYNE